MWRITWAPKLALSGICQNLGYTNLDQMDLELRSDLPMPRKVLYTKIEV